MPQLLDPNFERAVVLIIHHDSDGSFGVVLNRTTDIAAPSLCATLEIEWKGRSAAAIDWGGPVQPQTGWVIYGDDVLVTGDTETTAIAEGVFFAGSLDVLRQVARHPTDQVRVLLGYAGWGPGQLEGELAQGAWLSAPVSSRVVFEVEPQAMWSHVLHELGVEPAALVPSRGVH